MVNADILLEYMINFRVECHFRLDMVPGSVADLPMFIYEAAHEVARERTLKEFNLSEEDREVMDKVNNFFITKLKEKDHYGEADEFTVEAIKAEEFSK